MFNSYYVFSYHKPILIRITGHVNIDKKLYVQFIDNTR